MMTKWKIRTTYEGTSEDEILLPDGVEISSVFVKYGEMTIETKDGSQLKMRGGSFTDFDLKRPTTIAFWKEAE